jgi:hypothetical protein
MKQTEKKKHIRQIIDRYCRTAVIAPYIAKISFLLVSFCSSLSFKEMNSLIIICAEIGNK